MGKLKYLVMNPLNTGWKKPPLKYEYVPRHQQDVRNYGVSGFLLNK